MNIGSIKNLVAIGSIVVMTLSLAACDGGSDAKTAKGDTSANAVEGDKPELENKDAKRFFDAIASSDPEKMAAVTDVAAPGSIAAAYLQEQSDVANAGIDAGSPYEGGEAQKVDGGYENCVETGDADSCVTWANLEQVDGKLAKFTINDVDISDRIAIGDGTSVKASAAAQVEFLSAYKSIQADVVFVNLKVTSGKDAISLNSYSATYRGIDKRQSTATGDSTSTTELEADSTAYISLVFKASAIGGTVKLGVYDKNFDEAFATVKTG